MLQVKHKGLEKYKNKIQDHIDCSSFEEAVNAGHSSKFTQTWMGKDMKRVKYIARK